MKIDRLLLLFVIVSLFVSAMHIRSYCDIPIDIKKFENTVIPQREIPELKANLKPIEIKEDLSNIKNIQEFIFTEEQRRSLLENHILIYPSRINNPVNVYIESPVPFVTSDIMLHVYHVIFSDLLAQIERKIIIPLLNDVLSQLKQGNDLYLKSENRKIAEAAKKNAILLGVSLKLLNENIILKIPFDDEINRIIKKIHSAKEISPMDFTIYKPRAGYEIGYRSTYDKNPQKENAEKRDKLFKVMMWLQKYGYSLEKDNDALAYILMLSIIEKNKTLYRNFESLEKLVTFLAGETDGVDPFTCLEKITDLKSIDSIDYILKDNYEMFINIKNEIKKIHKPQISVYPDTDSVFLFPGRFNNTAVLFSNKLKESVKLPSGLDYAATVLDSDYVGTKLETKESDYSRELRKKLNRLEEKEWYCNYSTGIEYSLRALVKETEDGYPLFTQKPLWKVKQLNTSLGAWVQLQHDLFLYQAHAAWYKDGGGGFSRFSGYVEPNPEFFSRLLHSVKILRTFLKETNVFSILEVEEKQTDKVNKTRKNKIRMDIARPYHFQLLEETLERLLELSIKEVEGEEFDDKDHSFLSSIAKKLRKLTFDYKSAPADRENKSLICDVTTEYLSGRCLEIATGNPFIIVSIVPWGENLYLSKGTVFSYYEFEEKIENRLTDVKWKKMDKKATESLFGKFGMLSLSLDEIHDPKIIERYIYDSNPHVIIGAAKRLIKLKSYASYDKIMKLFSSDIVIEKKRKRRRRHAQATNLYDEVINVFNRNDDEKWLGLICDSIKERIENKVIVEQNMTCRMLRCALSSNHNGRVKDFIRFDHRYIAMIDNVLEHVKKNERLENFEEKYQLEWLREQVIRLTEKRKKR